MTSAQKEWAAQWMDPARRVDAAGHALSEAVEQLLAARDQQAKDVYRRGGPQSSEDFDTIAGREPVINEIVSVLMGLPGLRVLFERHRSALPALPETLASYWAQRLSHDRFDGVRPRQPAPAPAPAAHHANPGLDRR